MITFPTSVAEYIHSIGMTSKTVTAYLQLDEFDNLVNWEGQPQQLGVSDLTIGQPITEQLFFLEGMLPIPSNLMLRFVSLSEQYYAHVHIIPYEEGTYVLLFDATLEYERQQKMLQQVNESKLLAYHKNQLLCAMEDRYSNSVQSTVEPLKNNAPNRTKHISGIVRYICNFLTFNKFRYK